MAVEIYQNSELNNIVFEVEALEEWRTIASELQMDKQLDFVRHSDSPMPYPFINNSTSIVMTTLCPRKVPYKQYDKTPIPLEVLKQMAFSLKEKHFNEIEIWYDDKSPDPFAVGIIANYYAVDRSWKRLKDQEGNDSLFQSESHAREHCQAISFDLYHVVSEKKHYLIARWADELRPLAQLKDLAKSRIVERYGAKLKSDIEKMQQALKTINENATLYVNGEISESDLRGNVSTF